CCARTRRTWHEWRAGSAFLLPLLQRRGPTPGGGTTRCVAVRGMSAHVRGEAGRYRNSRGSGVGMSVTVVEEDLRGLAERGAAELGPDATAHEILEWTAGTFGNEF